MADVRSDEKSIASTEIQLCPFFGQDDDPAVQPIYASRHACCYRDRQPISVEPAHQRVYCIGGAYRNCPRWQQGGAEPLRAALDKENRAARIRTSRRRLGKWLLAFYLCLVAFGTGYGAYALGHFWAPQLVAGAPAGPATVPAVAAATDTMSATPTATATAKQPVTPTLSAATAPITKPFISPPGTPPRTGEAASRPAATPPPVANPPLLRIITTTVDLHQGPSADTPRQDTLAADEIVRAIGRSATDWYYVRSPDGAFGWLAAAGVTPVYPNSLDRLPVLRSD